MMKATIKNEAGDVILLLLGLSFGNLDRLRAEALDGFIKIKGEEVGLPADIIITAGESEAALMHAFGMIGPDTEVHISERLKS